MENFLTKNFFKKENVLSQFNITLAANSSCTCPQTNVDCGCSTQNVSSSTRCTEYHKSYDSVRNDKK